jgi:outer membrane protein assembly factor BamE (lipoprotein component of BamABCDE complex)
MTMTNAFPCFVLAAAMSIATWAANAADGISVTQREASRITAGMSTEEVRRLIGRPASDVQYRHEPGPVWLYHVTDAIDPVFLEISFGKDGRVANISQYVDPRVYTGK